MPRTGHKRTAYCNRVLPRADLVSVGEGGEGVLVPGVPGRPGQRGSESVPPQGRPRFGLHPVIRERHFGALLDWRSHTAGNGTCGYRRSAWAALAFRSLGSRLSQPRRFDRDLFFTFLRLREGYRAGPQAGLRFQW
jgi:hypothetical protein